MSDINLKRITVASGGNVEIYNGSISVTDTRFSDSSLTGSLLLHGSIGIRSTHQSTSWSSGGAVTLAGGIGVGGNTFVGGDFKVDTLNGVFEVKGVTEPRFKVGTIVAKEITASVDGLVNQLTIVPETVSVITDLLVTGGVSVMSTQDQAVSIEGGLVAQKDIQTGRDILVTRSILSDYSTEQIVLNKISSGSSLISNSGSTLVISNSHPVKISSLEDVFIANSTFGSTSTTIGNDITILGESVFQSVSSGNTNISGDLDVSGIIQSNELRLGTNGNLFKEREAKYDTQFTFLHIGTTTESVIINERSLALGNYTFVHSTTGVLNLNGTESGEPFDVHFTAKDNDLGDNVMLTVNASTSSNLKLGWDSLQSEYILKCTGGPLVISSQTTELPNSVVFSSTQNASNLSSGPVLLSGGLVVNKDLLVGGTLKIVSIDISQQTVGVLLVDSTLEADLFKTGNTEYLQTGISTGALFDIKNSIFVSTSGNIGIGTSSPQSNLDISGYVACTGITTGSILTGGLTVSNGIFNNSNASVIGSQTISGGSNLYGVTNLYGPLVHTDGIITTGTLRVSEISLKNTTNSTSTSSGSLKLEGGLGVIKDTYIGGITEIQSELRLKDQLVLYNNANLESFAINGDNQFQINRYSGGSLIGPSITIDNSTGTLTVLSSTEFVENVQFQSEITADLPVSIRSTEVSFNHTTGALIVDGGVGISGKLNVLGDAFFLGNITISGTTNSFYSTNTLIADNIISINSGPSGTFNAGILVERYQVSNDLGEGDVVGDVVYLPFTLPSQSGTNSNEIKLPAGASSVNGEYIGWWIKITSGFSVDQVRFVTGYIGATKIATLSEPWTTQNPSIGDTIRMYSKPFVGFLWDESDDTFKFISTVQNPTDNNIETFELNSLSLSTLDSIAVTTGNVYASSVLASNMSVGNLVVNGVNLTPNSSDIFQTVSLSGIQNATLEPILTFGGGVWGFDMYISIRVVADTNLYSNYHLRGVQKAGAWELIQSYVGDSIVTFDLTTMGVLCYSNQTYTGFTSLTFKYRVVTT